MANCDESYDVHTYDTLLRSFFVRWASRRIDRGAALDRKQPEQDAAEYALYLDDTDQS